MQCLNETEIRERYKGRKQRQRRVVGSECERAERKKRERERERERFWYLTVKRSK